MKESVEKNPYGMDTDDLLEYEIRELTAELHYHEVMSKLPAGQIHKSLLKVKKKTIQRLIDAHPYGPDIFAEN